MDSYNFQPRTMLTEVSAHCTALHCTANTILCCTALHSTALQTLYCTQHCFTLNYFSGFCFTLLNTTHADGHYLHFIL
jgi:hypothetical protein